MATQKLNFSEEKFWRMTMRKLDILWKKHLEIEYPQSSNGQKANKKGNDTSGKVSIDNLSFL